MKQLKILLDKNEIKNWQKENTLYIKGDAALICRCLESTQAKHIKQDGKIYTIKEAVNQLNGKFDIKFSIQKLLF